MALLAALISTTPLRAFAAAPPSPISAPANDASEQRRAQAKAKYQQGVEAYSNARYVDAVRWFLEADALSPSAALSYNIARAYEKLADDAQTLRWYRNYLRLNPRASNASEVQQYVHALSQALSKKGIQQLTVLSTPPGATVTIDSQPLGVTPLTVELKPGAHDALLSLRGYQDQPRQFTLSSAAPLDVLVEMTPALPFSASSASSAGSTSAGPGAGERRFGVAPWITLGAAAVSLGAAAVFELSRRSAENSAASEQVQTQYERDFDAMSSRQTTARVLLGVGGALAIGGAALLVLNTRVTPDSRAALSSVPGGATFSWERRF